MRAVVDTNVILDALADRAPWNERAREVLLRAARGQDELLLSSSCVTDIYFLLNKHVFHDHRQTRRAIQVLLDSFSVINVGEAECIEAIHSPMADYEDAVLALAAKAARADAIVTRDLDDYAGSPVRAISPASYLEERGDDSRSTR